MEEAEAPVGEFQSRYASGAENNDHNVGDNDGSAKTDNQYEGGDEESAGDNKAEEIETNQASNSRPSASGGNHPGQVELQPGYG